jgi:uncharacterized metal-binding protein YceD (DUF177 family)
VSPGVPENRALVDHSVVQLIFEASSLLLACDLMTDTGLSCRRCEVEVVVNDHSSSRETCVRRERSNNESMSECNKRLTHRKRHRHLGLRRPSSPED